jgi:hypothetical protein
MKTNSVFERDPFFPDAGKVAPVKPDEKPGDRPAHPEFDQKKKKLPADPRKQLGNVIDREA